MDRKPLKQESRISRLADRLARSSRVFMLGVIVACGVEVLVDWNATLTEINVLRDRMRERGYNYVGILARSTAPALEKLDTISIGQLTAGVLEDEDVAFVRFTKPDGTVVWEEVRKDFGSSFILARGQDPRDYYASQLARDVDGILHDSEGLRSRMMQSRYRDFAQRWSDAINALTARVSAPPSPSSAMIYQDRLRTPNKQRDDAVTWAVAAISKDGRQIGALVVAFSMQRTNAAIQTKYLKGLGMVVFFVGLILVQNAMSRRDKLRLLDLEARYAAAKDALRAAFAKPLLDGPIRVAAAIDQAPGTVDGMAWDAEEHEGSVSLAVVDPDGDGIDAAAVALHALRRLRATHGTPLEEARAVGSAVLDIPLTRPLGILVVRVAPDGTIDGIASPFADLRVLSGESIVRTPIDDEPGLVGPLSRLSGRLPPGGLLVGAFGHASGRRGRPLEVDEVAAFVGRAHPGVALDVAVEDAVTWARGRATALADADIAVVAMSRVT